MNQKTFKPNLDLVVARFSIFGMVAIVYTALSVNGLPSWFLWLVLLWGVFSIFEAAIKADEVLEGAVNTQTVLDNLTKRVIIQHRIIKYQDQSINQLIERKYKEVKELKASHHGELIGHEHYLKKVKQERDELQTLYKQQGIDMLELQKQIDALEKSDFVLARIKSITGKNLLESILIKEVRQVLKGSEA